MQPQRCPRCRSTWTEQKLSPRSQQSSGRSRKVVGDCAGGFHMAAGAVSGAASIYLRFIILENPVICTEVPGHGRAAAADSSLVGCQVLLQENWTRFPCCGVARLSCYLVDDALIR